MNIPKDIYEYLAGFADDRTIIDMLSVNKKFNDPIFFQRIFNRKYPLLMDLKPNNQDWKTFYLTMVKYIAKLGYKPKNIKLICNVKYCWN